MKAPNTDSFEPDGFYHCYNHAVGDDNLFRNRDNYLYFLSRFKQYMLPVSKCFAYCLMPNHFHFLLKIRNTQELRSFQEGYKPESRNTELDYHKIAMNQLSRMLNGYTQAYNKRFGRRGALFLDYTRRKQCLDYTYLKRLIHYIHHNPVHHGFCKSMSDWEFSSYSSLCSTKETSLERESSIAFFGDKDSFEISHSLFLPMGDINEFEL